jgi:hypothetical protein|tara:strand:+ start:189 stop:455 length:267 start_codon:yes stop_codon:yes gene_type:complete
MDDESSKLFKLLSEGEILKSNEISSNAKIISMNLDVGSLNISSDLKGCDVKNIVIKKTTKVIFLKTIITDTKKNNSQITSIWALDDKV